MNQKLVLICLFFGFPIPALSSFEGKASYHAPVELQWEKIADAQSYELEVQRLSGQVLVTVKSKKPLFRFSAVPGRYQARCRALDKRGVPGEWSPLAEVRVERPVPQLVSSDRIRDKTVIPPGETLVSVPLSWESVRYAQSYDIEIRLPDQKIQVISSDQTRIVFKASTGIYQYRVRARWSKVSDVSRYSDWSAPFEVEAPPLLAPVVKKEATAPGFLQFQKSTQDASLHAEVYRRSHLSTDWFKQNEIHSDQAEINFQKWAPGEYKLLVFFRKTGFSDSQKIETTFIVKPSEDMIQKNLK